MPKPAKANKQYGGPGSFVPSGERRSHPSRSASFSGSGPELYVAPYEQQRNRGSIDGLTHDFNEFGVSRRRESFPVRIELVGSETPLTPSFSPCQVLPTPIIPKQVTKVTLAMRVPAMVMMGCHSLQASTQPTPVHQLMLPHMTINPPSVAQGTVFQLHRLVSSRCHNRQPSPPSKENPTCPHPTPAHLRSSTLHRHTPLRLDLLRATLTFQDLLPRLDIQGHTRTRHMTTASSQHQALNRTYLLSLSHP